MPVRTAKMRRMITRGTALLSLGLASIAHAGDFSYTFDNTFGSADYLLGSLLVADASFGTTAFSLSSVLSDNTRAYVDLAHTQIYPLSEYSNSEGEIGLQFRYLGIQDNQMFAGAFAWLNRYHDTYSYYNSTGYGAYVKWKSYLRSNQLLISGYDLEFNRFEEVPEASNTTQQIYLTYNQSFSTKTSLNFRNTLAHQNFWPQLVYLDQSPGRFQTAIEVDSIPDNYLFESELRISQSLGPKLGATLWLNYQKLFQDDSEALTIQDGLNNPFIDRFRSEGPSTSMRLLYRLNQDQDLKFTLFRGEKHFKAVPVYEFDFSTMSYVIENDAYKDLGIDRIDEQLKIQASWSLFWGQPGSLLFSDMELVVNAGWTQNVSNDPLHDYESKNIGITLNINN